MRTPLLYLSVALTIGVVLYFTTFKKKTGKNKQENKIQQVDTVEIRQKYQNECNIGNVESCYNISSLSEKVEGSKRSVFSYVRDYIGSVDLNLAQYPINQKKYYLRVLRRPACKLPDVFDKFYARPSKQNLLSMIKCRYTKDKEEWKTFRQDIAKIEENYKTEVISSVFSPAGGFDVELKNSIYSLYLDLFKRLKKAGNITQVASQKEEVKDEKKSKRKKGKKKKVYSKDGLKALVTMIHLSNFILKTYFYGEPKDFNNMTSMEDLKFLLPIGVSAGLTPFFTRLIKRKNANKQLKVLYINPNILLPFLVTKQKSRAYLDTLLQLYLAQDNYISFPPDQIINTFLLYESRLTHRKKIDRLISNENRIKEMCQGGIGRYQKGYKICPAMLCSEVKNFQSFADMMLEKKLEQVDCKYPLYPFKRYDDSTGLASLLCHHHFQEDVMSISEFFTRVVDNCGNTGLVTLGKWIKQYGDEELVKAQSVANVQKEAGGGKGGIMGMLESISGHKKVDATKKLTEEMEK